MGSSIRETRLLRRRWLGLAATELLTVVSTARHENTAVDVSVSVLTALVFLAVLTRVGLVGGVRHPKSLGIEPASGLTVVNPSGAPVKA
jgi:hypothetical protein